jgi:hypothetical protein
MMQAGGRENSFAYSVEIHAVDKSLERERSKPSAMFAMMETAALRLFAESNLLTDLLVSKSHGPFY